MKKKDAKNKKMNKIENKKSKNGGVGKRSRPVLAMVKAWYC